MAILRGTFIVGGWTMVSRVLGFLRDIVIAAAIGTGPVADAWAVAFRFPNLFRRLFGEGAFNAAFVPLYAKKMEGEGVTAAQQFAQVILAAILPVLIVISALAMIFMPWIMQAYAPGFVGDPARFDIAIDYTQIAFPYLLFMSLVALYAGVLNTHGKFGAAAAAQSILNLVLIGASLIVWYAIDPPPGDPAWGYGLAWGVAFAGAAQFLFLAWSLARRGLSLRLQRPRLTGEVRQTFRLAVPGIIAGGVSQISIFVMTVIASLQDGAPAVLYYADRIYQFPLGIVGVAMGVVLLPTLSRHIRGAREDLARHWQNRGVELSMLLTLPASVALMTVSLPISIALFERGAFDRASSEMVATVLFVFAFGLPAFILNKVMMPAYFAREDTVTPMRYAVITLVLDICVSTGLFFAFGAPGIAAGTSLAAWVNFALLSRTLVKRGHFALDERAASRLPRILAASIAMGVVTYGLWVVLAPWFEQSNAMALLGVAVICGGGLFAYVVAAFGFGATSLGDLKAQLSRGA